MNTPEQQAAIRARHEFLMAERAPLAARLEEIRIESESLKSQCSHPSLPTRGEFEEHMDICPDCGHTSYLYKI